MNRYIVIPKAEAEKWKQPILFSWHQGMIAIEIDSGDYIVSEWAFNKLSEQKRTITIADKEVQASVELSKYSLVEEKDIIFKQPVIEQEIIKTK